MSTTNTYGVLNNLLTKLEDYDSFKILENVVTEDLLWTNPSPTSAFAAQTVALDLSGYDGVKIKLKRINNNAVYSIHELRLGERYDIGENVVSTTGVN